MKRLVLLALLAFVSLGPAAQAADLGPGYEAPRARIIARDRVVERYDVAPERRVYVERRYVERTWHRWGWRHYHW